MADAPIPAENLPAKSEPPAPAEHPVDEKASEAPGETQTPPLPEREEKKALAGKIYDNKLAPHGGLKLQSGWTIWWDKKPGPSEPQVASYLENLNKIGTFHTVEEFWRYYVYLMRPHDVPKDSNYHMFREDLLPAWESFPNGGCWIFNVKKTRSGLLARLWEELLLATIGEQFESDQVVGIVLSIRHKEDKLSVWIRENIEGDATHLRIGEKLKDIFRLERNSRVEYKLHRKSMADGCTFRNAKPYIFAVKPADAPPAMSPGTEHPHQHPQHHPMPHPQHHHGHPHHYPPQQHQPQTPKMPTSSPPAAAQAAAPPAISAAPAAAVAVPPVPVVAATS